MMRNLGTIVLLLAAPLAAQDAEDLSKFLPLAVGNSWTYEHVLQDKRKNDDGTEVLPERRIETVFTISVAGTEVIHGQTFHVFSDPSEILGVDLPKHFIAGKKLRWDGKRLVEHDGHALRSFYRFDDRIAQDASNPRIQNYSPPGIDGDTLVVAAKSPYGDLTYQSFTFTGSEWYLSDDDWDMPSLEMLICSGGPCEGSRSWKTMD